jgi:aminoacyl tRNA synthase complex-interacting multifunctional protein 1
MPHHNHPAQFATPTTTTTTMTVVGAPDLVDDAIAELEARLHLNPGEAVGARSGKNGGAGDDDGDANGKKNHEKRANKPARSRAAPAPAPADDVDLPDICKLEFKVGVVTKVWVHPAADKLYCEEIDVGESQPRRIASGLRPHFTERQMLGQRLLVVSNLKAKNLVGFKSHGMVLCAAAPAAVAAGGGGGDDGSKEKVEFVEPPAGAAVGEVVTLEGLPEPRPVSASQCEKKGIFQAAQRGMETTDDCLAAWNGHVFMTTAGPCRAKTIAGGVMR